MAKRRMLSYDLMRSDEFLDLPPESQLLYVHLLIEADDDGFLFGKKRIMAILACDPAAFDALTREGFILSFPSGASVIAHWPLFNKIPKDRYTPTRHQAEFQTLQIVPGVGYVRKPEEKDLRQGTGERLKENNNADDANVPETTTTRPLSQEGEKQCDRENKTMENAAANIPQASYDSSQITLPLTDGGAYPITPDREDAWRQLYPNVGVTQAFRAMRGWLISHPEKQKTARDIERFINHWLLNEQNKSLRPQPQYGFGYEDPRRGIDEDPPSYDAARAEERMNTTVPKLRKKRAR